MAGGDLFAILDGVSPWWWVAFAFLLGALEMATMSFFLIWPGLAAMAVAVALWAAPGMQGQVQIALFAVFAVAFTWGGRVYMRRRGPAPSDKPGLNRRSERLVGRQALAKTAFERGEGSVEIGGVTWPARLAEGESAPAGATLEIVAADGMTLTVKPL